MHMSAQEYMHTYIYIYIYINQRGEGLAHGCMVERRLLTQTFFLIKVVDNKVTVLRALGNANCT